MNILLHLTGVPCSGKSYILEEFKDNPIIAIWDIKKFYEEKYILTEHGMNWDKFKEYQIDIAPTMKRFIVNNSDKKIIIIESTGTNKAINSALSQIFNKTEIKLDIPVKETVRLRAIERGDKNYNNILDFRDKCEEQVTSKDKEIMLNQYEAAIYIKEWVNYYESMEKRSNQDNKDI